jgi:hypothetical protein
MVPKGELQALERFFGMPAAEFKKELSGGVQSVLLTTMPLLEQHLKELKGRDFVEAYTRLAALHEKVNSAPSSSPGTVHNHLHIKESGGENAVAALLSRLTGKQEKRVSRPPSPDPSPSDPPLAQTHT